MQLQGTGTSLRDFRLSDVDVTANIIGDDRVTRWLSFDSRDWTAAQTMVHRAVSQQHQDERYFAITSLDNETMVGFVRLEHTGVRAAKIGLAIGANHWRHGYGTEAVNLTIRFAFTELELHRITAAIGPDNHASISLFQRAGFTYEGRLRDHVFTNGAWRDSLLYSLLSHEDHDAEPTAKL